MLVEEKRLQWWGMDMKPRWRRRAAVLVGYAGFIALLGLWCIDGLIAHPFWAGTVMMLASIAWRNVSVFRVVKDFSDVLAQPRKTMFVNGLDEWARYRYGVADFESATAEQQEELLRRYRVGTFVVPVKPGTWIGLDEREKKEKAVAENWTLRQLALYLSIEMYRFLRQASQHKTMDPMDAAMDLWSFWLLVWTLPQARVLWTEPDPRETGGEMELMESHSA